MGQEQVWNVPYPRNPFFIGRDALLSCLHAQLQAGQATALSQPHAISGLGGIGKTQLAVEYAYRFHQDYQVVLWARAESQEALTSSYVTIASLLTLPEREAQEQAIMVQAVKAWLQTHSGWLLILDNADDLALVPAFLPPALGGHLLLTTRAQAMGRLAYRIEVDVLPAEQGALFLLRRATLLASDAELSQASARDRELAVRITKALGGLPLALDQAGAYIEETRCGLAEYQQRYRTCRGRLLQRRGGLVADHPEPVATTWSLAFERVEQRQPAAAELLRLCAFLHPDAIPEEILSAEAAHPGSSLAQIAGDPLLLDEAIAALGAYSLLQRTASEHTLSMHRLVQAVLRDAMPEAVERGWAERSVHAMGRLFPWPEVANWDVCRQLLPHAQVCAALIKEWQLNTREAAHMLNSVGFYMQERAEYSGAQGYFEQSLVIYREIYGNEHADTLALLNNLANSYALQGKYELALTFYQQVLAIKEKMLGAENLSTVGTLQNLANVCYEQGNYEDALLFHQRALHIRRKTLGEDHPDTAVSLNNLAVVYQAQGRYGEAESMHLHALDIRRKILGEDHPDTAVSLRNLALVYQAQGRYGEALQLFERALAIDQEKLGFEHPETKRAQENYETSQAMKRNGGQGTDAEQP